MEVLECLYSQKGRRDNTLIAKFPEDHEKAVNLEKLAIQYWFFDRGSHLKFLWSHRRWRHKNNVRERCFSVYVSDFRQGFVHKDIIYFNRCFPVNFAKFLRTHFFTEHLRWLLLTITKSKPLKHIHGYCFFFLFYFFHACFSYHR